MSATAGHTALSTRACTSSTACEISFCKDLRRLANSGAATLAAFRVHCTTCRLVLLRNPLSDRGVPDRGATEEVVASEYSNSTFFWKHENLILSLSVSRRRNSAASPEGKKRGLKWAAFSLPRHFCIFSCFNCYTSVAQADGQEEAQAVGGSERWPDEEDAGHPGPRLPRPRLASVSPVVRLVCVDG